MKYILFDESVTGWGDLYTEEFDDLQEAINEGEYQWQHLTTSEKKKRYLYVIESDNPDQGAEDHFNGNYVWRCDRTKEVTY